MPFVKFAVRVADPDQEVNPSCRIRIQNKYPEPGIKIAL
jgi:hypothetical protein